MHIYNYLPTFNVANQIVFTICSRPQEAFMRGANLLQKLVTKWTSSVC